MPLNPRSSPHLLVDLQQRIARRRVIAVVGAGVSMSATAGETLASWTGLLADGIERCEACVAGLPTGWADIVRQELKSGDIDDLLSAAQKVETKLRKAGEFASWLVDTIGTLQVRNGSVIDALVGLNIPIITTNYDGLIEKRSSLTHATWREPNKFERILQGDQRGILHIHGFYEDPESVILGLRSYETIIRDEFTQSMQRAARALNSFLFVGFGKGLDDPNFAALLSWARRTFSGSLYRHYRLALSRDVATLQEDHEPADRIFVMPYGDNYEDLSSFLQSLQDPSLTGAASSTKLVSVSGSDIHDGAKNRQNAELAEYLSAIRAAHGHIKFVEIPLYEDTLDVEIDNLFIEPSVSRDQILPDRPEADWPALSDLGSLLQERHRLVVLGDPGYGKSTLTSCLAWRLCKDGTGVPIPMIVRELQIKADITWEKLIDLLLQHRHGMLLRNRATIESLLQDHGTVVFLDGLDEIANLAIRKKLRDAIHAGMAQFPNAKWILTSRIVGYDQVPFHISPEDRSGVSPKRRIKKGRTVSKVADVCYLAPFSTNQIGEFAAKWYRQHESDSHLAHERSTAFVDAINDNTGTKRLARVPYLLTLMALIHRKSARLPHGRTDLYDRISTAYLESIDVRRNLDQVPYSLAQKKRWLAEAGYQLQLRRTTTAKKPKQADAGDILATRDEVCTWLSKAMSESGADSPDGEARVLLDYFAERSGLLVPRGEGLFAFMHLSLQEYFSAAYLETRLTSSRFAKGQRTTPTDKQIQEWANRNEWLEVYVLLFELLARKDASETEDLFEFLFVNRFEIERPEGQRVAARLMAELITDPYVMLSANTRREARHRAWMWVFGTDERGSDEFTTAAVPQLLIAERKGDLKAAWDAARFTTDDLKGSVRFLDLAGCNSLKSIAPLATLTNIERLTLSGCGKIIDISPLEGLRRLTSLSLSMCDGISDISPLSKLGRLESLGLAGCSGVRDLAPLEQLSRLIRLFLPRCDSFDSLQSIGALSNLEHLFIEHLSSPVNLSHLQKCASLKHLSINKSDVPQDLSPLSGHPMLSEIHLHEVSGIDISPLLECKALQQLCLAGSTVAHIPKELVDRGILDPDAAVAAPRRARSPLKRRKRDIE